MQPHCLLCTQSMSRDCSTTSLPMFRKLHSLPLHLSAVFHEPTTILVDDHHYPSYIVSLRKTKAGRRGRINLARPPRGPAPDARLTAPRRLEYVCLVCVCYLCWNAPHYRVCSSPVCCLLGVFEFQLGIVTSPTYTGGHFFSLSRQWHLLSHSCDLDKHVGSLLHPFIPIPRQTEVIRHDMPFSTSLYSVLLQFSRF